VNPRKPPPACPSCFSSRQTSLRRQVNVSSLRQFLHLPGHSSAQENPIGLGSINLKGAFNIGMSKNSLLGKNSLRWWSWCSEGPAGIKKSLRSYHASFVFTKNNIRILQRHHDSLRMRLIIPSPRTTSINNDHHNNHLIIIQLLIIIIPTLRTSFRRPKGAQLLIRNPGTPTPIHKGSGGFMSQSEAVTPSQKNNQN